MDRWIAGRVNDQKGSWDGLMDGRVSERARCQGSRQGREAGGKVCSCAGPPVAVVAPQRLLYRLPRHTVTYRQSQAFPRPGYPEGQAAPLQVYRLLYRLRPPSRVA